MEETDILIGDTVIATYVRFNRRQMREVTSHVRGIVCDIDHPCLLLHRYGKNPIQAVLGQPISQCRIVLSEIAEEFEVFTYSDDDQ